MFKLIIAASLLATGILGGIKLSQKHSARIAFYKSLCAFNCDYSAEMRFSRKKLREIMEKNIRRKYSTKFFRITARAE